MSANKAIDRLQPALLDRLRDEQPQQKSEPADAGIMSRQRLREAVLRDLEWLFNATAPAGVEGLGAFPRASRSVLGFGLPALSGETASSLDPPWLEAQVRRAITDHEPRILPESLRVEALMNDSQVDHHNQISIRISGQMWAQPVPLELLLHTDFDLETGRVQIRELSR